ncbi:MAG: hypothetical protein FWE56_05950 [Candidatus Bathyarchaeota archaeon]|nr:hypothetical protein [Candidatus Termiticorpusculum sp.]
MDIIQQMFVLLFVIFALMLIYLVYRAKKRPNNFNYSSVVAYGLLIFGSGLGILGHPILGFLVICLSAFLCLIFIIALREGFDKEMSHQIKKVDVSEPIRVKDFFVGWNLFLKLKRKYGTRRAHVLNIAFFLSFFVVMFPLMVYLMEKWILVNDLSFREFFFGGFLWVYVMIGPMIIYSFSLYFQQRRVLKNFDRLSTPVGGCGGVRFCRCCGASVVCDAVFCTNCGRSLQNSV